MTAGGTTSNIKSIKNPLVVGYIVHLNIYFVIISRYLHCALAYMSYIFFVE